MISTTTLFTLAVLPGFSGLPGPDDKDFAHCMTLVMEILLGAYFLGSIPSGLLIAKSRGVDIRKHGSGNIGATNVWRTLGKPWGLLAFFCDAFKGWIAVAAAIWIATHYPVVTHLRPSPEVIQTITRRFPAEFAGIAAAVGCIFGHNFPIWLRFRGGKGVATSLGVIIGMMPLAALIIFAVWGIVLKIYRYVSLASIVAAVSLPVTVICLMMFYPKNWWGAVNGWGNFYFAVAAALLVIRRHTSNIQRLLDGAELRFGTPKTGAEAASKSDTSKDSSPQS